MSNLKLYTGDTKLVIAIDIGTVFSGISYCVLQRDQAPEIRSVTKFPGQTQVTSDAKVPSLLYYDESGNVRAAGAEALTRMVIETAQLQGWMKVEWWKLHLYPKQLTSVDKDDKLFTLPSGKSIIHVLTDFIKYLFQCVKTYIEDHHPEIPWPSFEHSIEYIFTCPNGCEGKPQQLYYRAIEFADLVPSTPEGRSRVHILTEGEASLHFYVSNMVNMELTNHDTPQGVVIIDAGGGTVDLSMFLMASNPTSYEEIAPAECRIQGSVFVARRANVLIKKKLEGWERSTPEKIAEIEREFDQSTKLVIKSDRELAYVRVANRRYHNSKYNISLGKLKLTGKEATGVFKESFEAIVSAFEQQQKSATIPVTMAFLVGGLSTNDWLWSQFQSYFENKNINICRPDSHINKAVANGAILAYINHGDHLVAPRVGHFTYGAELNSVENGFSEYENLQNQCDAQPLIQGIGDFQQWMSEHCIDAHKPILNRNQSALSDDSHNVLAHNALLGVRSQNWDTAYEDAEKSIDIRPSAMGYIAKALTLASKGELEEAMQVFDFAFWSRDPNRNGLLLLIKAIILFNAGKYDSAISRIQALISISRDRDDETTYCCIQVLGSAHLMRGNYGLAVESLEQGRSLASSCTGCYLEAISTIFGWTFDKFHIAMQRCYCEVLLSAGRVREAVKVLREILDTFGGGGFASKVPAEWVTDLKNKCIDMVERLGDAALGSGKHDEAISHYSSVLSLKPSNRINTLVKRSKARASTKLWKDALADADEVIKLDPSSYEGYERKYIALRGAENYHAANNALLHMFLTTMKSSIEDMHRLRDNHPGAREAMGSIDTAIRAVFNVCPLVLIDLTTGRLCNSHERDNLFKSEMPFKKLVSEIVVSKLDDAHIRQAVATYFKWVMFSHTWDGKEPTFQDVNLVDSVWNLGQSPQNEKLRQFCRTAHEGGYRWAWSDTCCIDKTTSAVLTQSLTSMYTWYEEAAETIVYLADVLFSAKLGALRMSRWMTRAWTLQELLASKVIRFYNRDWKLYLDDTHANHKESPVIKAELAKAMEVASETITSFQPESLGVREKLRLASTRNATVEEDIAYSLIGIFSSDIAPRYGLRKVAIGHLLEKIVDRTGDVTVIAWTGKSLPYNSALPDSLAVYRQVPYSPSLLEADDLDTRVRQLCNDSTTESETLNDALALYFEVMKLPRATFSNRCLHLPCIMFPVTEIKITKMLDGKEGNSYCATVSLLGTVEFRTAAVINCRVPKKLVFVHPWLHDLCDPLHHFGSDDEEALRLIANLGRPFSALLLQGQSRHQYKRTATEDEIIISGVPYQKKPQSMQVKVLEII